MVYDVNAGLVLKYETRDPQPQPLNLSSLKDGTYFIQLFNKTGYIEHLIIISLIKKRG